MVATGRKVPILKPAKLKRGYYFKSIKQKCTKDVFKRRQKSLIGKGIQGEFEGNSMGIRIQKREFRLWGLVDGCVIYYTGAYAGRYGVPLL